MEKKSQHREKQYQIRKQVAYMAKNIPLSSNADPGESEAAKVITNNWFFNW